MQWEEPHHSSATVGNRRAEGIEKGWFTEQLLTSSSVFLTAGECHTCTGTEAIKKTTAAQAPKDWETQMLCTYTRSLST